MGELGDAGGLRCLKATPDLSSRMGGCFWGSRGAGKSFLWTRTRVSYGQEHKYSRPCWLQKGRSKLYCLIGIWMLCIATHDICPTIHGTTTNQSKMPAAIQESHLLHITFLPAITETGVARHSRYPRCLNMPDLPPGPMNFLTRHCNCRKASLQLCAPLLQLKGEGINLQTSKV